MKETQFKILQRPYTQTKFLKSSINSKTIILKKTNNSINSQKNNSKNSKSKDGESNT